MAADVVLVDTDDHVALVPGRARARTTVVPVGAGADWFAVRAQEPHGRLRAVFFGLFTPLQGTTTIGEALGLLADAPVDVTMIGTGQDYAAAQAAADGNPHVTWIDWVDSADLPAVVADHQVCLGIVGTGAKALRVVPNKVYQGAAAGCAIVTSDTAPQRQALGDAAVFVPPGDGAALATELRALASDPARVADLQAAARSRAKARFSAEALGDELVTAITAARQARLGAAMGQ
jgi:glycosyltransferase involved in cell wall biosynthesis